MASHLCSSTLCIILTALDTGIQNIQNMFWYLAIKRSEIWAGNKSHLLWSNGYVELWLKLGPFLDQIWPKKPGPLWDGEGRIGCRVGIPAGPSSGFIFNFRFSVFFYINTACWHISHVSGTLRFVTHLNFWYF